MGVVPIGQRWWCHRFIGGDFSLDGSPLALYTLFMDGTMTKRRIYRRKELRKACGL